MNKILFYHLSKGTNNYLGDQTNIKVGFIGIKSLLYSTLFIFILISFIFPAAWAADYYVDKNNKSASDSNPGTADMPWKTIQRGANVAKAGDTVFVKKGIYYEWVDVKNSGEAGKPITFKVYPGDKPIIDGTGVAVPSWKGLFYSNSNNYITIDGFELRNTSECLIHLHRVDHLTIKNCVAHSNSGPASSDNNHSGILIKYANYGLIENNEVYDTGHNCFTAESSNFLTFQHNYAHDNPAHVGYNIFPRDTENPQGRYYGNVIKSNIAARCMAGIYIRYQVDAEISNNLIYASRAIGIYLTDSRDDHPSLSYKFSSNTKIFNNTLIDNGHEFSYTHGGIADFNATDVTIKNNIIVNNSGDTIYIGAGITSGIDISNNLYDTAAHFHWDGKSYSSLSSWKTASKDSGSLGDDLQFVNKSAGDYTLKNRSANTIGKGADLTTVGISVGGDLVPPAKLRIVQK
jgi:parallel beta-helix repeat protein